MQVDAAASSLSEIQRAADWLRWVGGFRMVGAALVAVGVSLELAGEVLGHSSERTLRSARDAEIAALAAQVETLRRTASGPLGSCVVASESRNSSLRADEAEVQACPLPPL